MASICPSVAGDENGLIGYWTFDEGAGSTTSDNSGNEKNGTLNGPVWSEGKFGNALQFDGKDDNVKLPSLFSSTPSALTVMAWINSPLLQPGHIFYNGYFGEFNLHQGSSKDNDNYNFAVLGVKIQGSWVIVYSSVKLSPNNWHHVAGVWMQGEYIRIYVDGILSGELTDIPDSPLHNLGSGYTASIGSYYMSTLDNFKGIIDECKLYNTALNSEEIELEATITEPTESEPEPEPEEPQPELEPTPTEPEQTQPEPTETEPESTTPEPKEPTPYEQTSTPTEPIPDSNTTEFPLWIIIPFILIISMGIILTRASVNKKTKLGIMTALFIGLVIIVAVFVSAPTINVILDVDFPIKPDTFYYEEFTVKTGGTLQIEMTCIHDGGNLLWYIMSCDASTFLNRGEGEFYDLTYKSNYKGGNQISDTVEIEAGTYTFVYSQTAGYIGEQTTPVKIVFRPS